MWIRVSTRDTRVGVLEGRAKMELIFGGMVPGEK